MSRLGAILNFGWVAAPKAVGGVCLVLLNVHLISRMTRDNYAIYSLCLALLTLLSEGLFGAAVDMAVLKLSPLHLMDRPELSLAIERTALRFKLLVVGGLSLVMWLYSEPLSKFLFHQSGNAYLLGVVALAACCSIVLTSLLAHLQIRGQFYRYGWLDWLQMSAKYVGIAFVLWISPPYFSSIPPAGVLVWFAIAPALSVLCFGCWVGTSIFLRAADSKHWRSLLISQGKWMLVTLIVSMLVSKLDVFLLTSFSTMDEVAIYSGGQTLASIPLMLGTYLAIVLNPKVMPYGKAGRFFPLLRDVQLSLLCFGILVYAVVFTFREPITNRLLPDSFVGSQNVFLVLLPMTLAGMMSYPLTIAFLMYVRPRMLISMECLLLLPTLIAYCIAIPRYGALGAAVVTAVAGIVKSIIAQGAAFYWGQKSPLELGFPDASE